MLRPRNQRPIRSVAIALWGEPGETRRGPPKLLLRQTPREVGTSGWDGTWSQFPTGGTKGLCLRVWLGRAEGSSLLESAGPQKTEPPKRAKGTVVTSWAKPSTCHHSCWKELCLLSHPRIREGRQRGCLGLCFCPPYHRLLEPTQPWLRSPASKLTCCAVSGRSPSLSEPWLLFFLMPLLSL